METKEGACVRRATQRECQIREQKVLPLKATPIRDDWQFREVGRPHAKWLPVSRFPTNVHLDLIHHGLIPDPNIAKNENDVQWVGEKSWAYKTTFSSPDLLPGQKAVITFDGLDTHATVVLNSKEVLRTENMFLPARLDITQLLNSTIELEIVFESTYLTGKKVVESDPHHKYGCWNGRLSRSFRAQTAYMVDESRLHPFPLAYA